MTAQTPVYGIKYPVQGEPIRTTRQILEDNAKAIEAAMLSKALAPPASVDLAAALARIGTLENALNPSPAVGTTELSYAANWAGYQAAPWTGVRYWRRGGIVTVAGPARTTAAVAANSVVGTLPPGFRPPIILQQVTQYAGTILTLNPDGTLVMGPAQGNGAVIMISPTIFGAV